MIKILRQFLSRSNVTAVSLFSVAASIAVVGLVWAGSGALGGLSNSVAVSDASFAAINGDESFTDDSVADIDVGDYNARLDQLNTRLDEAIKEMAVIANDISEAQLKSDTTQVRVTELSDELQALQTEVALVVKQVREIKDTIDDFGSTLSALSAVVQKKTSLLNNEGRYTGAIAPNQISPQLRVTDVFGDWPLHRTTGELVVSKLYSDLFSCTSDMRNHAVISVDAFRRMICLRIPK